MAEEILKNLKDKFAICARTFCGYCVYDCPAFKEYRSEAYTSRGKMNIGNYIVHDMLKPTREVAEIYYRCTLCGWCEINCALENTTALIKMREYFAEQGLEPEDAKQVLMNFKSYGNIFGVPNLMRAKWAEGLNLSKRGRVLIFAGCNYPLIPGLGEILVKAVKVLRKLGVEVAYLFEEEPCCGAPLYMLGYVSIFRNHAEKVAKVLRDTGSNTIVTLCPACANALRKRYTELGIDVGIEILHISEYLDKLDFPQIKNTNRIIAYHDPCELARHLGIVDEPRRVLRKAGYEVKELWIHKGKYTFCCGAGGAHRTLYPDNAASMAMRRIEELITTKAKIIATSCPACLVNLRAGVLRLFLEDIEVKDLVELVYETLFTE